MGFGPDGSPETESENDYAIHDDSIQTGIHIAAIASADKIADAIATPARKLIWTSASARSVRRHSRNTKIAAATVAARNTTWTKGMTSVFS